ncbi:MAG: glycosyltransferase [Candidatus Pacebacteria bacterium]|nr:glycosyltransferase [Candidatus Paceibacterota bacterium]
MKISLLVPCFNEEKAVEACIISCLRQTRKFDEIIFIDDSSTDKTPQILSRYADRIIIKKTAQNSGNKSRAQEFGMNFVTGDIFVTTDADTILNVNFTKEVEKSFEREVDLSAMAGYVSSLPYNWITLCRAFDYVIGQNIHKLAQSYLNFMFVMPGVASAFKTEVFRKYITFDHDTITEDLDFTYKLHNENLKINYNRNAISYTQDPPTLHSYINQMRRWYGGGWQNLLKHYKTNAHPVRTLELSLMYIEGVVFSFLLFATLIINPYLWLIFILFYLSVVFILALWTAWKEKRPDLVLAPFPYIIIVFINTAIFIEQFVKEVILKRKNLIWFRPERVANNINQV